MVATTRFDEVSSIHRNTSTTTAVRKMSAASTAASISMVALIPKREPTDRFEKNNGVHILLKNTFAVNVIQMASHVQALVAAVSLHSTMETAISTYNTSQIGPNNQAGGRIGILLSF